MNDSGMMGDTPGQSDGTTGDTGGGGGRGTGSVTLSQTVIVAGPTTIISSSAFASFTGATTAGGTNPCMTTMMGDCQVSTCSIMASDAGAGDGGTPPATPHAGAITISGGAIPMAMPIMLTPGAGGAYMPSTSMMRFWMGAGQLRVQAAGMTGGVPMFDQMLAAPGDVMITMPTVMPGMPLAVNRANAFEVRWTGGMTGRVNVSLSTFAMSGGTTNTAAVICRFMASAGMGSVPSAALMRLQAGTGTFAIGSGNEAMVAAGNYDITVSATAGGTAGQAMFN